ncbi:hypothetical protein F0562_004656 [Nyssa sinensis]|uniref:RING-type domain-containing protein n=1 Tax=Nyssa sinensis TaxID=561372 RepID=A0A5J5BY15_9ASTE|nr:hypothetical protein F0562_004656 [Nyssa sinensis]
MVMVIVISVILLFVGIGVLILIHVCIVGRAFRRGFGNTSTVENGRFGSRSMSQDDLEKLPCFDFKGGEKGSSTVDCAVCLDNFKVGDKCRLLPQCRHSFHAQCVDSWLLKTPICPICRTSADAGQKGGSDSGQEISHFSDRGIELTESQAREIATELREGQTTEIGHLSVQMPGRAGQLSAKKVAIFSDSGIELTERQAREIATELREGQTTESGHLSGIRIELRGSQTIEFE